MRSATTISAGSTTAMATSEIRSPTPATTPSSRSPWNSVNHARKNPPAAVHPPITLPGSAVRIMCRTAASTPRCRRASRYRDIMNTP
jgi:hypothetical protein